MKTIAVVFAAALALGAAMPAAQAAPSNVGISFKDRPVSQVDEFSASSRWHGHHWHGHHRHGHHWHWRSHRHWHGHHHHHRHWR